MVICKDKEKKNTLYIKDIFKVFCYGLRINIKTFPVLYLILNIMGIFHGILYGFSTFMTQQFFDSVANIIVNNGPVIQIYLIIVALGFTSILREVFSGAHNFMDEMMTAKIDGEMTKIIHEKMAKINSIYLEDVTVYDDIEKASSGAQMVHQIVNKGMTILTLYVPYFIFMGFYLHNLKSQFIFVILLVFIPILFSQFIRTSIVAKFEDNTSPVRREFDYYKNTITGKEYYKETRILGAFNFFYDRLLTSMKKLSKNERMANRKTSCLEFCMSLFSAGSYIGVLIMLVTALLSGDITVGMFAAVFNSIDMLFFIINELVSEQIGDISTDMGKALNFIRFIELPERGGVVGSPLYENGIVAENISFTYPYSVNKSIDDISIKIREGETIAIVGENGSGKTTLVRLLLGLYIPTVGKVFLNGMDTSIVNSDSLSCGVSGVFQRFQQYKMTLMENIKISDVNGYDFDYVLDQAGVNIDSPSYPEGSLTMLSREFGGVDLSGGEWQRIAIARGLYRIHNVIVLDEPTAAIDPIEENRIYNKFVELSKGKMSIIVTHRLGSTKIADRIIVMNKGKIVGIGSHQELYQKCHLYTKMFNSQANWYIK